MRRFVLFGAAGWGNLGDDLIAASICAEAIACGWQPTVICGPVGLTTNMPQAEIIVNSRTMRARLNILRAVLLGSRVGIGGGGLLDDRNPNFFRPFLRASLLASFFRKRLDLIAVGVGPIRHEQTKRAYSRILSRATIASVRDEASRIRLALVGAKPLDCRKILVINDPAIWPSSRGFLDSEESRREPMHALGINLRPWTRDQFEGQKQEEAGTDDLIQSLVHYISTTVPIGSSIAMLPMSELASENDVAALKDLERQIPGYRFFWPTELSVQAVSALTAACKQVISMRLHAMLIARKHSIPVLALAYDRKLEQQAEIVGAAVLSLTNALDHRNLEAAIKNHLAPDTLRLDARTESTLKLLFAQS